MSFYPENLCRHFNNFIIILNEILPNNEVILSLANENAEQQINRVKKLANSLSTSVNFNNFCKSKIKVFSHKEKDTHTISESLFGSQLSLKKIFNNQPDEIKDKLWLNLHNILKIYLEQDIILNSSKELEERIKKLKHCVVNKVLKLEHTKKSIQNIFKTDQLNPTTNEMIDDIFKSFENVMTGKNTMESILNLSNELSSKYEDKINNGEIDFNGLLDSLKTNIPGMENMKSIIDPLLKMNGMNESDKHIEPIIIDENFSTSNVEIGKVQETSDEPILGNIIKMANNTGVLNMLTNKNDNNLVSGINNIFSGDNNIFSDNKQISKLFDVVNKLKESGLDNREAINNIFKNDLGIDVTKINQEMATIINNNN